MSNWISEMAAFVAAETRLGIQASEPTVARAAAPEPATLSRVRRSSTGAGTLTICSGVTVFPDRGGTIGLTSRTHKEYPFLTCLSVTTQDTRTWRSPFRSCAPGYRRGTALARGGWCAVKEHPLTEDTSFHAKLYKEAPYFQPGENGDTRKRPDE